MSKISPNRKQLQIHAPVDIQLMVCVDTIFSFRSLNVAVTVAVTVDAVAVTVVFTDAISPLA